MRVPIIQVPWCLSVEVDTMGGGSDKDVSINETLIRFPVSVGFKRLLLMQQCDGMWIVHHCGVEPVPTLCKWTRRHGSLPATTYSQGSQSWPSIMSPQMETHPFLTSPTFCQTDAQILIRTQTHTHTGCWKWREKGRVVSGKSLIRALNILINPKQLTSWTTWGFRSKMIRLESNLKTS